MIRIRQIKVAVEEDCIEILYHKVAHILKIDNSCILHVVIHRRSIDARKKNSIYFVYEVDVEVKNEEELLRKCSCVDIFKTPTEKYRLPEKGSILLSTRPVVVGSGPAGLFTAYLLAECGYQPLVIERGECIENRVQTVETFWNTGTLNVNSNVQFGEGGAGTFSDGKLNTLVKDTNFRMRKVFEILVACGASADIMYESKPHIGTDVLREVVIHLRKKIISMGGAFAYNTCLTDLIVSDNKIQAIEVNHESKIPCSVLVLALGHSARDTFKMLLDHNLVMRPKPFAIGLRIQHPQAMIDHAQYGEYAKYLQTASYKLTYTTSKNRGVYSFCMCPGGYVVNASSQNGKLCINGMSNHARDTKNANSAIVVTVSPKDYGLDPLDGMELQQQLEERAYHLASGKIPIQCLGDFLENKKSTSFGDVKMICKGDYGFTNLNDILPSYITESLKEAFPVFGRKIKGFDRSDAILAGIESRTSSPICMERDDIFESNIKGVYPCGEGAGYAGGITTSAMDGMKVAEAIIKKYGGLYDR